MPPKETHAQKRRRRALARGVTSLPADFAYLCKRRPERIGIVAEGDSWFAYPRKWIAFGADINIVHHIEGKLAHSNTANLLRLASNGDEAVNMLSGKQKDTLARVFERNQAHIDIVLFSGGGNDIIGKRELLPLLHDYREGYSAIECIDVPKFERKLEAIALAYTELIDLRDEYIPHATLITHTYDIAMPQDQGAEFFWGLVKTKPWIYPYLEQRNIPPQLHLPIVQYLLRTFKQSMLELARTPHCKGKIKVVNTQGTLRPGHKRDWLNEIHPTAYGFKRISKKIYSAMRKAQPDLPGWYR